LVNPNSVSHHINGQTPVLVGIAPSNEFPSHFTSTLMSQPNTQVLSWTAHDPRDSVLFTPQAVWYRFRTERAANGQVTTTLIRTLRLGREDRVGKLEWGANGSLGRAIIGKNTIPMSDMCRAGSAGTFVRSFNGPDGYTYTWKAEHDSYDVLLCDSADKVIARFHPVRPTASQYGNVYGELHFYPGVGMGTVTHPPMMDMVILTSMIYRYVTRYDL